MNTGSDVRVDMVLNYEQAGALVDLLEHAILDSQNWLEERQHPQDCKPCNRMRARKNVARALSAHIQAQMGWSYE